MSEIEIAGFGLAALIVLLLLIVLLWLAGMRRQLNADPSAERMESLEGRLVAQEALIGELMHRQTGQAQTLTALRDQGVAVDTALRAMNETSAQRDTTIRTEFKANRDEVGEAIGALRQSVSNLAAEQAKAQSEFRDKLDEKMAALQAGNEKKLDEMRRTVDEHLQTTLEKRITESFKTVAERLDAVQKGLGEMQTLATGVGDLKRVLTNVKSRGTFGEVQLEALVADLLTPGQYEKNYDCGKLGGERVEFGVRLPGGDVPIYLPIDAKFPTEDYERLLSAVDAGDRDGAESASKALETRVRKFAKDVASKYINPPSTTDWAILFLPTEGLYAEILRRPGLFESLQRDLRVTIAGPTNIQVLLSTFRMGFRQVAMNEQARVVMQALASVRREFDTYGDQIAAMAKNADAMRNHLDKLSTRRSQMLKALDKVELPTVSAETPLLGDGGQG